MTNVTLESPAPGTRRPRPGPGRPHAGYQVAPPVIDDFAAWAVVLEQCDAPGEVRLVAGPDGVLLPIRHATDTDHSGPKGRPVRNRLAGLFRH